MCTSLQEKQRQLHVVLLPRHQPVGLDVAFPLSIFVARELVWAIPHGQRASGFKQVHRLSYVLHVKTTLDATAEVLFEAVGSDTVYAIAIDPFPCKSPLASHNDTHGHASHRPLPRDSLRSW